MESVGKTNNELVFCEKIRFRSALGLCKAIESDFRGIEDYNNLSYDSEKQVIINRLYDAEMCGYFQFKRRVIDDINNIHNWRSLLENAQEAILIDIDNWKDAVLRKNDAVFMLDDGQINEKNMGLIKKALMSTGNESVHIHLVASDTYSFQKTNFGFKERLKSEILENWEHSRVLYLLHLMPHVYRAIYRRIGSE